jgi:hypothetical protein
VTSLDLIESGANTEEGVPLMAGRHKASDSGKQRGKLAGQVASQHSQTQQQQNLAAPAEVGIIFLRGNTLLIDSTPVNDAVERYPLLWRAQRQLQPIIAALSVHRHQFTGC